MLVTEENFDQALDGFAEESRLVVDTETTGIHPWQGDRICGVSLATPALEHICYFPFRHRLGQNLSRPYLDILIGFLNRRHLLLTGWNLKFDIEMLWFDGLPQPDYAEDVMLACHHLDENDKPFELKRWAARRIDPLQRTAEAGSWTIAPVVASKAQRTGRHVANSTRKRWKSTPATMSTTPSYSGASSSSS